MNVLNYEILDAIDGIEECTYQAEQSVFNSMMNEYQKSISLLEYVEPDVYDQIIYQESSTVTTKTSSNKFWRILSKLWEGLQRVVGFLVRGVKTVIDKVLFMFGKTKKTASQIAEGVVVDSNQMNRDNYVTNNDNKVLMSVDPHSVYKPGSIQIPPASGLITKFMDNGSIEISTNCGTKFFKQMVLANEQKGSGSNAKMLSVRSYNAVVGLHVVMYNDDIRGDFFNVFKQLSNIINMMNNKTNSSDDELSYLQTIVTAMNKYNQNTQKVCLAIMHRDPTNDLDKINEFNKNNPKGSKESIVDYTNRVNTKYNDEYMKPLVFKLKDIQNFSIQLNELNKRCIQPIKLRECIQLDIKNEKLKINISSLMNAVNELQYSINVIMNMVSNSFTIDQCYFKSINDPEKLDEFVGALIDAGIPSRYIGYNAWLISGENITSGDPEFKPRWGQTRLCLLPNDKDICYKIALSGLGKSGNATEYKVYNELLKNCELLCPCLKIYKTQSVVMSKRAEFIDIPKAQKTEIISGIIDELAEFIVKINANITVSDVHSDNIGIVDGKNTIIDYGEINWG